MQNQREFIIAGGWRGAAADSSSPQTGNKLLTTTTNDVVITPAPAKQRRQHRQHQPLSESSLQIPGLFLNANSPLAGGLLHAPSSMFMASAAALLTANATVADVAAQRSPPLQRALVSSNLSINHGSANAQSNLIHSRADLDLPISSNNSASSVQYHQRSETASHSHSSHYHHQHQHQHRQQQIPASSISPNGHLTHIDTSYPYQPMQSSNMPRMVLPGYQSISTTPTSSTSNPHSPNNALYFSMSQRTILPTPSMTQIRSNSQSTTNNKNNKSSTSNSTKYMTSSKASSINELLPSKHSTLINSNGSSHHGNDHNHDIELNLLHTTSSASTGSSHHSVDQLGVEVVNDYQPMDEVDDPLNTNDLPDVGEVEEDLYAGYGSGESLLPTMILSHRYMQIPQLGYQEVTSRNLKKRTPRDITVIQKDNHGSIWLVFEPQKVFCEYDNLTQPLKLWVWTQSRRSIKDKEGGIEVDPLVYDIALSILGKGNKRTRLPRDPSNSNSSPISRRLRITESSRSSSPEVTSFASKRRRTDSEMLVTRKIEIVNECQDPSVHIVPTCVSAFNSVLFNGFTSTLTRFTTELQRQYDDLRGVCHRLEAENRHLRSDGQPQSVLDELKIYKDRCHILEEEVVGLETLLAQKSAKLNQISGLLNNNSDNNNNNNEESSHR